jgi:hypothetical protein
MGINAWGLLSASNKINAHATLDLQGRAKSRVGQQISQKSENEIFCFLRTTARNNLFPFDI